VAEDTHPVVEGADGVEPLLEVRDLSVIFPAGRREARVVDGISLTVRPGERVAMVGESGSGKSISAAAVLGLVPAPGRVEATTLKFDGVELSTGGPKAFSRIRGAGAGLVLQDPVSALDPLKSLGAQVTETLRLTGEIKRSERNAVAVDLLRSVEIAAPESRINLYPHQLSGGMAQRVLIASAIARSPKLLIADEPTSALDATTANAIVKLMDDLVDQRDMAALMISHDLGLVAKFADRVIVLYSGRVVETGTVADVFGHPRHPYTRGLLESVPGRRGREAVHAIPGSIPDPLFRPEGCTFRPRCALSQGRSRCTDEEPLLRLVPGTANWAACHFAEELLAPLAEPEAPAADLAIAAAAEAAAAVEEDLSAADEGSAVAVVAEPVPARAGEAPAYQPDGYPGEVGQELIRVDDVWREFKVKERLFQSGGVVQALRGVGFAINPGDAVGLVGETGSGKSTLGRLILGLDAPTRGRVLFQGHDLSTREGHAATLGKMQVVFQNPDRSLDPKMKVSAIVGEPLQVHKIGTRNERRERVESLLEQVGLGSDAADLYPHQFSGGQRQRIAIARALALRPDFVLCDEPVAALDVSIQAQILNLLQRIQREEGLSYVFVGHDLAVVRQVSTKVMVMYLGQIMEYSDSESLYAAPQHPYSVALLSAMSTPSPGAERGRERVVLKGEQPSPLNPPQGCPFHTRCWKADDTCRSLRPPLVQSQPGRWVACFHPETVSTPAASVAAGSPEGVRP
jgi:peptide/nickel transport system ATP-binding protein